jgi:rubrerythrin
MTRPRFWDETTDPEDTLWVCVSCGSELHADCVGDECPVCGARVEDGASNEKE